MNRTGARRYFGGGVAWLAAASLWLALPTTPALAQSAQCFGTLNSQPYSSGFSPANFVTSNSVQVGSTLKLNTGLSPLDTQHIVLPFDQHLTVDYVYESAGASHTLGWMFLDQLGPYFNPDGSLKDPTGQTLQAAIYTVDPASGSINPSITRAATGYSDGGLYPHIPNLLEPGYMIFKLCDDDTDTTVFGPDFAPVTDVSATNDGVPDYDVNGDGVVDVLDRTVDLGTIAGGREIVFYLVVYYDQTVLRPALGLTDNPTNTRAVKSIVFFSKDSMNPERGAVAPNSVLAQIDLGCNYGSSCSIAGTTGWLDAATLSRMNTTAYGNISMPQETHTVSSGPNGYAPHMILGAPSTYPNIWLLGWEDLVLYDNTSCPTCTHSDRDFNDVVFMVHRQNGGQLVSQSISTGDIPAGQRADTVINRIHIKKAENIPIPPCTAAPNTRIDYYYSIDGGVTWTLIVFPPTSPNEVTIELLQTGLSGSDLRWRADIVSPNQDCQPEITDLEIGYSAVEHGTYSQSSPVPLANVIYRGSFETPASTWVATGTPKDFRYRGHFEAVQEYDPSDPSTDTSNQLWEAGQVLAAQNPDARVIYTGTNKALVNFVSSDPALQSLAVPAAACSVIVNGTPIFDVDGNGTCDATDGARVIDWTRGWETPGVQRAWKLGSILHSTAAIIGPPGIPAWMNGTAVPSTEKNEFRIWSTDPLRAARRTVAYVGAEDGMLHAFDAGQFRYGDDPVTTSITEQRGYFLRPSGTAPDYGDGHEVYAYIPWNLLDSLRNNWAITRFPTQATPQAEVDASIGVADVKTAGSFRTMLAMPMGQTHPYIHALDITDATKPAEVWTSPWTDVDYHGTRSGPPIGRLKLGNSSYWAIFAHSGISDVPGNLFLYAIDAETGLTVTNGKAQLNAGTAPGVADLAFGIEGHVVPYDTDNDGYVDRVYAVDTNGRLWKWDTGSQQICLLANVGQAVYSAPVLSPPPDGVPNAPVAIYFATGDDPDAADPTKLNYIFGFTDMGPPGSCSAGDVTLVYQHSIAAGEKVWADPFATSDAVYFASAGTDRADLCTAGGTAGGSLYQVQTGQSLAPTSVSLLGNAASGIFVSDEKVLVNTVGGKTQIIGAAGQNNNQAKSKSTNVPMSDEAWSDLGAVR